MKNKTVTFILLLSMAMASCEKKGGVGNVSEVETGKLVPVLFGKSIVVSEQQIGSRATDSDWETGDNIGITMVGNVGGNVITPINGGNQQLNLEYTVQSAGTGGSSVAFNPTNAINTMFYPLNNEAVDIVAYHPYNATLSGTTITLNTSDQSDYKKLNLLWSNNIVNIQNTNTQHQFTFKKMMAKLTFNIMSASNPLTMSISGMLNNNSTTFDIVTGQFGGTIPTDTAACNVNVVNNVINNKDAMALIIPQQATITFYFTVGGITKTYTTASTNFEAGKEYIYNVTY